jgi:hypothetical protein
MKYFSQNHDVVINASGGYAVLERLGFKTEGDEMAKKKKATAVKTAAVKTDAVKSTKVETAGLSRNQLMEEVKSRGIKNFRVMNKAELAEIVGGAKPDRVEAIMKEAVSRWKSGWGTKKEK